MAPMRTMLMRTMFMRTRSALQGFINTFPPLWASVHSRESRGTVDGEFGGKSWSFCLTLCLDADYAAGVFEAEDVPPPGRGRPGLHGSRFRLRALFFEDEFG